jgi:hypothetical protein
MHFIKSKKFWLTVAHVGTAAVSIGLGIAFPGIRTIILGIQAGINGIIPSPVVTTAFTESKDSSRNDYDHLNG